MVKFELKKIGGIFIVLIMVASGFAVAAHFLGGTNKTQKLPENAIVVGKYTFYQTEDGYYGIYLQTVNTGKKIGVIFRLDPREAGKIPLEEEAVSKIIGGRKVYITYNPNQENISSVVVAAAQVARIIPLLHGNKPVVAYTEDANPVDPNIPLKTCEDATEETPVIVFEVGNKTQILEENNCIHVQGENYGSLILAADKLGMNLVGIRL